MENDKLLSGALQHLSIHNQAELQNLPGVNSKACGNHLEVCAICLDKILLEETAFIKGCEHAYCVTCILRWATYKDTATCPQCKLPFESLIVHRSLDGSLKDFMSEESVCLLLRASWFEHTSIDERHDVPYPDFEDYSQIADSGAHCQFDSGDYSQFDYDGEYCMDAAMSGLRIGNRRWGGNGYIRAGRKEARPVHRDAGASSSKEWRKEVEHGGKTGRRAKRKLKREAATREGDSREHI